ncbi:16S rRNA (adenine(1518)-N(6)/adenine(1519)-N(6))-dimethyltransferase RsmA ['Fragaria x ananassa' phyllody phytoplasma]|uniref:Ribosomal RNA small subunit methyltransferase A n=1 Tax='Fragaria x ananassa' phyllody phytoplasma TaxID=2358428 RepID=A0ABS5K2Y1_9MOLU|nr:16S rRNA (adenine(1518)-N(6)/adenine(1519)-N(6))-dimethyltransferase RsmA ['Fragaria x ananassa' phyllody phytoplasma]MBS2126247.1 16S rRNA (adenine(1518)-N(6)/adenine(1519)-N(6))-dimethyltransferase RsmA ['Fragaria x ananassa' phyllody phytoplasma]
MQHQLKKKYGQNFLKDNNLLKSIVSKASLKDKNVIEIGPGKGALTQFIIPQAKHILAYEIDFTLKPFLVFPDSHKIDIIYEDFLKRDLTLDFATYFPISSPGTKFSLISNLPYYITSPILFKIIDTPQINDATMMMQKEVGLHLMAQPNNKNYNALSVMIQFFFDIYKVKDVSRYMFSPKPKVDSIVIKLKRKPTQLHFESLALQQGFIKFVKASFKQKRKILLNNLAQQFSFPKELIILFFKKYKIPLNIRAEQIILEEFKKITLQWLLFSQQTQYNK